MTQPLSAFDPAQATRLVRQHVDPGQSVIAVNPLHGGMVYHVTEWILSGSHGPLVAKLHPHADHRPLFDEHEALRWYRQNTRFPVPQPYACVSGDFGTCLLMERAAGHNLESARIAPAGRQTLMIQLAVHLAHLHSHQRDSYGSAVRPEQQPRWLDHFEPMFASEFEQVRDKLTAHARWVTGELLANLAHWLPEAGRPTMIHGDLWQTNIIVDDARPDRPIISAFIDVGAAYCDAELELAYLRLFRTVDRAFMDEYTRVHPLRNGFARRCRVYWLYFMLLHVRHFGPTYLKNCESLARQIEQMAR